MVQLDVRQESSRHADALNTVTEYLGLGSYKHASTILCSTKLEDSVLLCALCLDKNLGLNTL